MSKKKILLVEDDVLLLESTTTFLEEEGYKVFNAKNGIEGVEIAIEAIPDIILCDIAMPRMNGYEVQRILAENSATSLIPFVFVSAKTEKEDIRAGMQMGADDYITKPFDFDELLKAIEIRIAKKEKLLSASEEGFKALLESAITGVFILSDDQIIFANSKMLRIYNASRAEVVNSTFFSWIYEADRAAVSEKIRRCLKGIQSNFQVDFTLVTAKNERISVQCWGKLTKVNGHSTVVGNIIRVDEQKVITKAMDGNSLNIAQLNNGGYSVGTTSSNSEPLALTKHQNPDELTKREIEVLRLICQGLTNNEIAEKLFLSNRTVDTHRGNLLSKTGMANTAELVVYAIKNNFFSISASKR